MTGSIVVGVLALQGAFHEHFKLLRKASPEVPIGQDKNWEFLEVRNTQDLEKCDALIIPGGETESANRTKKGGQELIGGLDVRVNRNYFGRQTESFEAELSLPFLKTSDETDDVKPFNGVFIRAPVVEKILPVIQGEQANERAVDGTVIAPSQTPEDGMREQFLQPVEVMASLPGRSRTLREKVAAMGLEDEAGHIIAVKQGNVFGTSFHPELTEDARIHVWWLQQVKDMTQSQEGSLLS